MRIALETLGCKLNQAETESLVWQLVVSGYQVVDDVEEADVYILNTCTVTGPADAKARRRLRAVHARNPGAFVVATGCYAQREPGTLAAMPGVGLIVSNEDKSQLLSILNEHLQSELKISSPANTPKSSLRTRAFIKVQDGCHGVCAYCIVPTVRAEEKSIPAEHVLGEIKHRLSRGIKEIVLTGTKVGSYNDGGRGLSDLLGKILTDTPVPRLRLSSLQPQEITPVLLALWDDPRLCPHFHLSIQSGNDATLRSMRRRYSVPDYARSLAMIRELVPEAAVTTDVIVGFPGETDAMFEESVHVCRELQFARIHVFPYSPRPGTEAALLPGRVDSLVKRERTETMLSLAEESARSFRAAFRGRTRPVLWERRDALGDWAGLTDNYIPVTLHSDDYLENCITQFILA